MVAGNIIGHIDRLKTLPSLVVTMALAACSGGGNPPPQPAPAPAPAPTPQPGIVQFTSSAVSVDEQAGTVQLTITRTGGSDGAVSVTLASGGISANAGQDYTELLTTVSFAARDATAKTVNLSITDDGLTEADETFMVALVEPTGGVQFGSPRVAVITIRDNDAAPAAPATPSLALGFEVKQLAFLWLEAARATSYKLMRRDNAGANFAQVGAELAAKTTTTRLQIPVHRYNWAADGPQYRIDACNAGGCASSNVVDAPRVASLLTTGYVKASDTTAASSFGKSVAVSGDGRTVAIGAPGVQGGVGSVYIYSAATSGDRVLAARPVKISPRSNQTMLFGFAVALSEDGDMLAVGAPFDDHRQSGVGVYPDVPNVDALQSGGVFIYTRVGGVWSTTPVYIKASDVDAGDHFGFALALGGGALVVGAPHQDSPTEDDSDVTNAAEDSGAVYTFSVRTGAWVQSARILKAANLGNRDNFGSSVALSGDASVLIVGAPNEDGDADTALDSGAAYRFVAGGGMPGNPPQWGVSQLFKATNSAAGDMFGISVAVDASGRVFAVGAQGADNMSGAVYAYTISAGMVDVARLTAARRHDGARYGSALAISGDGTILAVGSSGEPVDAVGVDDREDAPATVPNAGAVDVLALDGLASGRHYVKAINTDAEDFFGAAVGLNHDGNTLVVGAPGEDGNGTNIDANNNPVNNSAQDSGAGYLY